jgi:dTDP-4-amino-4,6-dideoxygalactose transaminase
MMWARKRLDIGWSDLGYGIFSVFFSPQSAKSAQCIEKLWPSPEHTMACLSVRSGFDLLLGALKLPRGSEVLISAITILDMVRILEHHGLVPIPVDLEPQRMAPTLEHWRQAITPATKAILIAHLFGGHAEMEPILDLARRHDLRTIEDCAQAFAGIEYQGHPEADASMFSFGTIKSNTALGGAVLRVRDSEILAQMRAAQATYPVQRRWLYLKRLAKYATFKLLTFRPMYEMFIRGCRAIGFNYDTWLNRASRGFPGRDFLGQIRQQPAAALLAVLKRRLQSHDPNRLEHHMAKGRAFARFLEEKVACPGSAATPHTYWVFPILADEPNEFIEELTRQGWDATQGQSLCVVPPSVSRLGARTDVAEKMLKKIVFVPFYPELPTHQLHPLTKAIVSSLHGPNRVPPPSPTPIVKMGYVRLLFRFFGF